MKDLQLNLFEDYQKKDEDQPVESEKVIYTSMIDYLNAKYNGIFVKDHDDPEQINGYFNNGFSFHILSFENGLYELDIYFNGDLYDVHREFKNEYVKDAIKEIYNTKKNGYQLIHCGQCWMHNTDKCYSLKYHITGMKDDNMCGHGELYETNLDHFEKEICNVLGEDDIAPCSEYGILNKDGSFFNCRNRRKLGIKCTDCKFCYNQSSNQECDMKKMHWAHTIWKGDKNEAD